MNKRLKPQQESAIRFRMLRLEALEGRSLLAGILSGGITEFVVTRYSDSTPIPPPAHIGVDLEHVPDSERSARTDSHQNAPVRKVGSPLPIEFSHSRDGGNSISHWLGSHGSKRHAHESQRSDRVHDRDDDRKRLPDGEGEPPQSDPIGSSPPVEASPTIRPPATVIRPLQPNGPLPSEAPVPTAPTPGQAGSPTPTRSIDGTPVPASNSVPQTSAVSGNNSVEFDLTIDSDYSIENDSLHYENLSLNSVDQDPLTKSGFTASHQYRLRMLGESLEARAEKLALSNGIDHALSQLLIPSQFEPRDDAPEQNGEDIDRESRANSVGEMKRRATLDRHSSDADDGLMAISLSEHLLPTLYSSDEIGGESAWAEPLAMTRGQGFEVAGLAAHRPTVDTARSASGRDNSDLDADSLERLRPVIAIASATIGAMFIGHRRQKEADKKRQANNDRLT
ncbi:MAG: hypothetical protein ACE361_04160 [Aureliella sp.]